MASIKLCGEEPLDPELLAGPVLEFRAPLEVSSEVVELYFFDLTKSHVRCQQQGCVLRVTFSDSEALQRALDVSSYTIKDEGVLTLLSKATTTIPSSVTNAEHPTNCLESSAECQANSLLASPAPQAGQHGNAYSSSFVVLTLHVDSRVHITKHCLKDLMKYLKDSRYLLHRTAVPGELVLEWRGPASERDDQLVIRQIYEYADTFLTIVVGISETLAETMRTFLTSSWDANLSCTKINQQCKDQLYIITGKKKLMAQWRHWLPSATLVHHSLLVPFTSVVGMESKAIPEGVCASDAAAAAATKEVLERQEAKGLTVSATEVVQSDALSATVETSAARSSVLMSCAASDLITDKLELAGSFSASNPSTCQLNKGDQLKARRQPSDSPSESHVSSVACSTSTSDDALTQEAVHRKSSSFSTDQPQPDGNPGSRLLLLQGTDRQKALQHDPRSICGMQRGQTQQEHEILRIQGNEQSHQQHSEFSKERCDSVQITLTEAEKQLLEKQEQHGTQKGHAHLLSSGSPSMSKTQGNEQPNQQYCEFPNEDFESVHTLSEAEKQWLDEQKRRGTPRGRVHPLSSNSPSMSKTQGNEQPDQQYSEFPKEDFESVHILSEAEQQWLDEQRRRSTPRGRVHPWPISTVRTSTTGKQLEHEPCDSEIILHVEIQQNTRARTGDVIFKDNSNAAPHNGSVVQVQQQIKLDGQRQTVAQTLEVTPSPHDSQTQASPLEQVGHSGPKALDADARKDLSLHLGRSSSGKESSV